MSTLKLRLHVALKVKVHGCKKYYIQLSLFKKVLTQINTAKAVQMSRLWITKRSSMDSVYENGETSITCGSVFVKQLKLTKILI